MRRTTASVSVLLLAAGCSSATTSATSPAAGSSGAPAAATTTAVLDATQTIGKLKAAGLPVGSVITYTAASDPNHMLGRPNDYTSMASWADTRISASEVNDSTPGSVDLGGDVEVFSNSSDAQARASYIQTILKSMPMLGAEYDYVVGDVLVRVSGILTPDQAAAYKKAASS